MILILRMYLIQTFSKVLVILIYIHPILIGNSEVWDIRTFHLLKTVPELDQCQVKFTNNADIIYAVTLEQETGTIFTKNIEPFLVLLRFVDIISSLVFIG